MSAEHAAALAVRGLSLQFGGVAALREVSFDLQAGSVLGIIGPNGSGKTSLLNCISGAYRPQTGSIHVDGRQTTGLAPHRIAAAGVARTFQHVEVPRELTVLELAMLGRHRLTGRFGLLAYGLGVPWWTGYEQEHERAARRALELVGLADVAHVEIGDLPYGLAKRADLARALAAEPTLLLLDEPAAGLQESERHELAELIERLAHQALTLVLVEHDMRFVFRVCRRILVMAEGTRVFEGEAEHALADETVKASMLGEAAAAASPRAAAGVAYE